MASWLQRSLDGLAHRNLLSQRCPKFMRICLVVVMGFGLLALEFRFRQVQPTQGSDVSFPIQPIRRLQEDKKQDVTKLGYLMGEELVQTYDMTYVTWSLIIAACGAYVAFTTTMYMKQVAGTRWYWIMLVQAGLALGFSSVWSMHYIGMNALHLRGGTLSGDGEEVRITFEPSFTIISAFAAWLIASLALHIALSRPNHSSMTTLDGKRISCTRTSKSLSIRCLVRAGGLREALQQLLADAPVKRISIAASILTVAVCIMHYMGMLSQCGSFRMEYSPGVIVASGIVASVACFAGLTIFFVLADSLLYRAAASIVVSGAVNGMHYTGMESARYYAGPYRGLFGENTVSWIMGPNTVLISVFLLNFLLMCATGYYIEVLEMVRKREGEAFERELRYKNYCKESKELIHRSRVMRYPMCLIRYDTFVRQGRLIAHEHMRDANRLVYINSTRAAMKLRSKGFIVFFSHQWLSGKVPDPANRQFQDMLKALGQLSKIYRCKPEHMYIWVDYSSIPQEGLDQQQLAIDSIATYVSAASAFVIVAPQVLHSESQTPCNFMTYSRRCWCRLEVFCSLLSTLKGKKTSQTTAIPEEEHLSESDGDQSSPREVSPRNHVTLEIPIAKREEGRPSTPSPHTSHSHSPASDWGERCSAGLGLQTSYLHQARRESAKSANSASGIVLPPPPVGRARQVTMDSGESILIDRFDSGVAEQHRVFLVVDERLHRLNFFTQAGTLRKEYEDLLFVFEGDLECCARGHIDKDGRPMPCDKMKLVPSLCGCYGAMLTDLKRNLRREKSDSFSPSRNSLADHIIKLRKKIFPDDFFDTRIDAMESQVHNWKKDEGDLELGGGGDSCGSEDMTLDEDSGDGSSKSDATLTSQLDLLAVEASRSL